MANTRIIVEIGPSKELDVDSAIEVIRGSLENSGLSSFMIYEVIDPSNDDRPPLPDGSDFPTTKREK